MYFIYSISVLNKLNVAIKVPETFPNIPANTHHNTHTHAGLHSVPV